MTSSAAVVGVLQGLVEVDVVSHGVVSLVVEVVKSLFWAGGKVDDSQSVV